ncbi:hypothetical protein PG989_004233 [Apiospora arundinis]
MVKLTALAVTAVATLTAVSSAANCEKGLKYCGWDLEILDYDNYTEKMLKIVKNPDERFHTLFTCTDNGDIEVDHFCGAGKCNSWRSKECGFGPSDCCIA